MNEPKKMFLTVFDETDPAPAEMLSDFDNPFTIYLPGCPIPGDRFFSKETDNGPERNS